VAALTDTELAVLDFEAQWWRYSGAKEEAIRERFGTTPTLHYQRLVALLQRPEALAARPQVVRRLQRLRSRRAPRAGSALPGRPAPA